MKKDPADRGTQTKEGTLAAGKGKRWLISVLCVLAAVLLFFSGWYARWFALGGNARSLLWAVEVAKDRYYRETDEDALYERFFEDLSLDPYSAYYSAEEYRKMLSSNSGNGSDTGIALKSGENDLRIFRVAGNSPAERAGLRTGMYILGFGADENSLRSGNASDLVSFVASHEGNFVLECGFDPAGGDGRIYTLASETYRVSSALYRDSGEGVRFLEDGSTILSPEGALESLPADFAYIRVEEFYGTVSQEFVACLERMKEKNKKNLILDLRCNGGGYLDDFRKIASHLMRNAEGARPVAATARFRNGSETVYRAFGNDFSTYFSADSEIYLLADENTASASECLIGAMVSYGTLPYGHIFLREENGVAKSYGKGIMQQTFTDPQGNAYKLTTAEIFWPDGTTIHGKGVTEEDGAVGVKAPLLPGARDEMLEEAIARIKG